MHGIFLHFYQVQVCMTVKGLPAVLCFKSCTIFFSMIWKHCYHQNPFVFRQIPNFHSSELFHVELPYMYVSFCSVWHDSSHMPPDCPSANHCSAMCILPLIRSLLLQRIELNVIYILVKFELFCLLCKLGHCLFYSLFEKCGIT